ncbi:hypothetical protein V6669_09345 [Paenibacillus sp. Y5S-9]|uniref:hypothetical protein n=1 Tax=Paenibacillus sp. Y5S-9 TaxID=3122489 RepID=UPI0030CBBF7E
MFSIYDLSKEEDRLIQNAKDIHGRYFTFTKEVIEYSWTFIEKIDATAYVFNAFSTQMNKSLSLSLLSIIRLHTIQAYQSLRNAIESVGLASYSLYKPNQNNYVLDNPEFPGHLIAKKGVSDKVNKWLNNNYPSHSDKLRSIKSEHINKHFAHSNLTDALTNVHYIDNKTYNSVFDETSFILTKIHLVSLSNMAIHMIDLLGNVLKDYPLAKIKTGHSVKLDGFHRTCRQQYLSLKNDATFPKY